jgi:hypothetical protein
LRSGEGGEAISCLTTSDTFRQSVIAPPKVEKQSHTSSSILIPTFTKNSGMKLLKKILVFILVPTLIIFLVYRGLTTVDKNKQEEKERMEKLAAGTCKFDSLPLDHLLIEGFAKPLKFKMSLDSMKYIDPEETEISYSDSKDAVYLTSLNILHAGPVHFLSGDKVILDPSWSLSEFAGKYPQSYTCRDQSGGALALSTYLTITNENESSPIRSMTLAFGPNEKIKNVSVDFAPGVND